ncbi:unnamed protein product, partial [Didymodactylos carnosus]
SWLLLRNFMNLLKKMAQPSRSGRFPLSKEEKDLIEKLYIQFGSKSTTRIVGEMINNPQIPTNIQQLYQNFGLEKGTKRVYDYLARQSKK